MKQFLLFVLLNLFLIPIFAQPDFTANDTVPSYDKNFLVGINPSWHGNQWTDQQLANLAHGYPADDVEGIGMQTFRVTLPDAFLEFWGYDIRVDAFQHYIDMGMEDLTVFLQEPAPHHKDTVQHCPGDDSQMFLNMYTPIWDGGLNGTPVNDTNFAALYIYQTVSLYGENVKFWEIYNEPDFGNTFNGWRPPGMEGNWWENTPGPCDSQIKAPVYHYIRLLKIAYEVIKTLDDDAFIAVGGIGFESYLDVLLRHTDNPDGGQVTAEYPLKGGAYFDALSFHSYPHFNGTLVYFDSTLNEWIPRRHSDAAADGIINHKDRFETVLFDYGYDGTTFPKKEVIITETGIPSKQFNDWIGTPEAQRNFVMKVQLAAIQNEIRQIDFYNLANFTPYDQANSWLDVMGLYEQINDSQPYDYNPNQSGIGCRTMTQLIGDAEYDADLTALLDLPEEVNGGAFHVGGGEYVYALWAATQTDQSEVASYVYTFPQIVSEGGMNIKEWDYSVTGVEETLYGESIELSGDIKFIDLFLHVNSEEVSFLENVNVLPNPFQNVFEIQFELLENRNFEIELYDVEGKLIQNLAFENKTGLQKISINAKDFPNGIYFAKIKSNNESTKSIKLVKIK